MRRITLLLTVFSVLLLCSCEKEECIEVYRCRCYSTGYGFENIELDPASLCASDGTEMKTGKIDGTTCSMHLSWIDIYYEIDSSLLTCLIHENYTGKRRYCKISAIRKDGTPVFVKIIQKED